MRERDERQAQDVQQTRDVRQERADPPPPLGSWRAMYVLVLAELAVLVAVFYALTRWVS